MKLFVTGGTGFIGSHFLEHALAAGHHVTALRRSPQSKPRLALSAPPRWVDSEMTAVAVEDLAGHDALVHFAAVGVSPQKADWATLFRVNVTDSLALWIRAADAGIQRFLICGSCFEFGRTGECHDFIPPDAPLQPTSPYGASKAAASIAASALASSRQLQMAILRPFHAFGEGQHPENFWPSLRRAALAGDDFPMTAGAQMRDFVPVEQVADAFLRALAEPLTRGRPLQRNVGSGHPTSLLDFAQHWWQQWHATGQLQPGAIAYSPTEVMRYVPALP